MFYFIFQEIKSDDNEQVNHVSFFQTYHKTKWTMSVVCWIILHMLWVDEPINKRQAKHIINTGKVITWEAN